MNTTPQTLPTGTLRIMNSGEERNPEIYFNCSEHYQLVDEAVGKLITAKFRPNWVFALTNGGASIGLIIARCFKLNPAYWSVASYSDPASGVGAGKRRKEVCLAQHISWVSPDGLQNVLPSRLDGNVLIVDDLVDSDSTLPAAKTDLRRRFEGDFNLKTLCLWRKLYPDFLHPDAVPGVADFMVMDIGPESGTGRVPWIKQYHEWVVDRLKAKYSLE